MCPGKQRRHIRAVSEKRHSLGQVQLVHQPARLADGWAVADQVHLNLAQSMDRADERLLVLLRTKAAHHNDP